MLNAMYPQLNQMRLNKLASEAYNTYETYARDVQPYEGPQQYAADKPVTYAGLGAKAGASVGALLSVGAQARNTYNNYKATSPRVPLSAKDTLKTWSRAGVSGALLWGALGGLSGGLVKRKDEYTY